MDELSPSPHAERIEGKGIPPKNRDAFFFSAAYRMACPISSLL
jgi:hypothetical protein